MKRILYINPGNDFGGGEKTLLELMENLPSKLFKPFLLCPGEGYFPSLCREKGVEVYYLPTIPPPGGMAIATYRSFINNAIIIRKLASKLRIDLIHSNSVRAAYHGGLGARFAGIPSITHARDYVNSPFRSGLKSRFLNAISDRIITVSDATKNSILINNNFLINKTIKIYDGISQISIPSKEQIIGFRESIKATSKGPILAVIGAISELKGQLIIIQALPKIKKIFPNVTLLIVGNVRDSQGVEYEKKIYNEVQKLELTGQVLFLGFQKDIYPILKTADILVHPAIGPDAFPHILLEAGYLQTPVVASDIGGIPEIIEDRKTGYLSKPGDINELSSKIIDLFSNKEKMEYFSIMGKERVSQLFMLSKNIEKVTDLYRELLG